eukprot:COSAG06_NODE_381_length_16594_cov_7.199454_6_plen_155_part_00
MNLTEIESAVRQRKPNIKDNSVKAYALSLMVDTTSLHGGTYHKSLMYANNFQAIIPANSGTGWLPLQVRTHAGVNKFSVDLDGNIDAGSGSITTTGSLSVGAFSTSSLSVVGNSLVHASTGFTTDAGGTYNIHQWQHQSELWPHHMWHHRLRGP